MVWFDFIILFLIAGWAVCFHGAMITEHAHIARGRLYMTIFFGILFALSVVSKAGVFG